MKRGNRCYATGRQWTVRQSSGEVLPRLAVAAFLALVLVVAWTPIQASAATYEELVSATSPSAWFRFSDPAGSGTVADVVGPYTALNDGISLGQAGPFGANESGTVSGEGYASLPGDPLSRAAAFTAEAWIRRTGAATTDPVFAFGSSVISQVTLLAASTLTKHPLSFEIDAGGNYVQMTGPTAPSGTWEYVAITETSAGVLTLYLDGAQAAQLTGVTLTPASVIGATHNYLGRSTSGISYFTGSISNLAFYPTALSPDQILERYDAAEVPLYSYQPSITGTPRQGKTLKIKQAGWTGLEPIVFGYQWLRCPMSGERCVEIPEATGNEYSLVNADVGQSIRAAITASNSLGTSTATSEPTEPVAGIAPGILSSPAVTGTPRIGQLLSATAGSWEGTTPISYHYQWQSCKTSCGNIAGATEPTFRIQEAQRGRYLRVVVKAANVAGSSTALSAETPEVKVGPPIDVTLPTVSGTPAAGQQLRASTGAWGGTSLIEYAYTWNLCDTSGANCQAILGAHSDTYSVSSEAIGHTIRASVTASNGIGEETVSSPPTDVVVPAAPVNVSAPTITGDPQERSTLTASTGSWTDTGTLSYAYRWKRCAVGALGAPGSGLGQFREPADIAEDSEGDLWALDSGNDRLEKLNHNGVALSQLGTPGSEEGQFSEPSALAIDKSGNLWVVDTGNDRVEEFSPSGSYLREVSAFGEESELEAPEGVAVDRNGDVVVSDGQAGQLVLFGENGEFRRIIGHKGSEPGAIGEPGSVAVDSHGDIYTTDWGNDRIDEFNEAGEYVNEFGGERADEGQLEGPFGLAVLPDGEVVVGDVGADRIDRFSAAGQYLGNFGSEGTAPGELELEVPTGITATASGVIWAADTGNDRLEQFTGSGEFAGDKCEAIVGATTNTYTPTAEDVGDQLQATVTATDANGEASSESTITSVIGYAPPANISPPEISGQAIEGETFTGTAGSWQGAATAYTYEWQRCDSSGTGCSTVESGPTRTTYRTTEADVGNRLRLVVTATNPAGEVQQASSATAIVVAAAPRPESSPTIEGAAKDGATLKADVGTWSGTRPVSYSYEWQTCNVLGEGCIAIPGATSLSYQLTAEQEGARIGLLVTASNAQGSLSAAASPTGIVTGSPPINSASPLVTGTPTVGQMLTAEPGEWQGVSPISFEYQWQRCSTSVIGSEGTGPGQFTHPSSVAVDTNGDIWVADNGNDRVQEFNSHGVYIRQFGSEGSGPGELDEPSALATDAAGDVYVADTANDRVEEFSPTGDYVRSLGATTGELDEPEGLAIDAQGNVWVSDTAGGRLQEYAPTGERLRTVSLPASGEAPEPVGVAVDTAGDIWVADAANDRIVEFSGEGELLREIGSKGSKPGQFEAPYGLTVTSGDEVLVADVPTRRVEAFNTQGTYLRTFTASAGSAPGHFEFGTPMGLTAAGAGLIWLTDTGHDRIEAYSPDGAYLGYRCEPIEGAADQTYTPASTDLGTALRVTIAATNVDGLGHATSSETAEVGE